MRNIRFIDWINGDEVKLTLKVGQSLTHRRYSENEEGYTLTHEKWEATDEGELHCITNCESRDCDGRFDYYQEVKAVRFDGHRPQWEKIDYAQRDYSAEAAGY